MELEPFNQAFQVCLSSAKHPHLGIADNYRNRKLPSCCDALVKPSHRARLAKIALAQNKEEVAASIARAQAANGSDDVVLQPG